VEAKNLKEDKFDGSDSTSVDEEYESIMSGLEEYARENGLSTDSLKRK